MMPCFGPRWAIHHPRLGWRLSPRRRGGPLTARIVVLVSGAGTNLQALLDETQDDSYGAQVVAVGADRENTLAEQRAHERGIPTFVAKVSDFATREDWDTALTKQVAEHQPTLVICAGFMKLLGKRFLEEFQGRTLNTHPALSPSFPGMRGAAEALEHGVKVTGCTLFFVDDGVDSGPIVAQDAVPVLEDDTEATLHERIKAAERVMLVDAVGRLAREGFTINGRKVTIP